MTIHSSEQADTRRVVLIGAESTGKTTLATHLAAHYRTAWLPEYVRQFVEAKGASPVAEDVPAIARGHLAAARAAEAAGHRLLLYDTDLVSTCVYSRYYYGACPAWIEQASREHHADLYLFTDTDIPWEPDPGQRDGPEVRAALHELFREELDRRGLPYVLLSGSLDQRLRTAIRAIDALLAEASVQERDGAHP